MGLFFNIIDPFIRFFPLLKYYICPYPINIELEFTNKCNKRCLFCEHTYWEEENTEISFEQFEHIISQFPNLKWINMTGEGECFLHKDFLKMLKYLKGKNIVVYFVESFDRFDLDKAKEVISLGIDGIYISLDAATKETYERIKDGCNFEQTLENIRNFINLKKELKSPLPDLTFRYIVTTINYKEMPGFINIVNGLGDKKWISKNLTIEFVGLLSFPEIENYYLDKIPDDIIEEVNQVSNETGIKVTYSHAMNLPKAHQCLAFYEPYIMMGGYILPCCAVLMSNKREFLRKSSLGNIFENSFKEIWYSENYKNFRKQICKKKISLPLLCRDCRAYDTRDRQ